MRVTSSSDLRQNLTALLDSVEADHTPLLVTREDGKPPAILMSLEDFSAFEDTRHLLCSKANADRLLSSIAELEAGGGDEHSLFE